MAEETEKKLRPEDVKFARVMFCLLLSLPISIFLIVIGSSTLLSFIPVYALLVIFIGFRKEFFGLLRDFFRYIKG